MLKAERELKIINILRRDSIARLSDLGQMLEVSENTVRRDLQRLENMGILNRTHGGAVLSEDANSTEDLEWLARQNILPKEKERIGSAAAELIKNGEAIILDAGTTTIQIAKFLNSKRNITIVTNAVNIGMEISNKDALTVVLTGGILREISKSLIGPLAEDFLKDNIHVDKMFLSAGGVTAEHGITNANTIEVPIKRAMVKAANEVILVVTHDKIGNRSFTHVVPIDAIDKLITDKDADENQVRYIQEHGVEVIMV